MSGNLYYPAAAAAMPTAAAPSLALAVDRILLFGADNELFVRYNDHYSVLLSGDTTAVTLLHPNAEHTRHVTSCATHLYRLRERLSLALHFRSRVVGGGTGNDRSRAAEKCDADTVAIYPSVWPPEHQTFQVLWQLPLLLLPPPYAPDASVCVSPRQSPIHFNCARWPTLQACVRAYNTATATATSSSTHIDTKELAHLPIAIDSVSSDVTVWSIDRATCVVLCASKCWVRVMYPLLISKSVDTIDADRQFPDRYTKAALAAPPAKVTHTYTYAVVHAIFPITQYPNRWTYPVQLALQYRTAIAASTVAAPQSQLPPAKPTALPAAALAVATGEHKLAPAPEPASTTTAVPMTPTKSNSTLNAATSAPLTPLTPATAAAAAAGSPAAASLDVSRDSNSVWSPAASTTRTGGSTTTGGDVFVASGQLSASEALSPQPLTCDVVMSLPTARSVEVELAAFRAGSAALTPAASSDDRTPHWTLHSTRALLQLHAQSGQSVSAVAASSVVTTTAAAAAAVGSATSGSASRSAAPPAVAEPLILDKAIAVEWTPDAMYFCGLPNVEPTSDAAPATGSAAASEHEPGSVQILLHADDSCLRFRRDGFWIHTLPAPTTAAAAVSRGGQQRVYSALCVPDKFNPSGVDPLYGGRTYPLAGIARRGLQLWRWMQEWNAAARAERTVINPPLALMNSFTAAIREEVVVSGVGHFTSFRDGRVRVKFYDRTVLELSRDRTMFDIIDPQTGRTVRIHAHKVPASHRRYTLAATEFAEFTFQSDTERVQSRRRQLQTEQRARWELIQIEWRKRLESNAAAAATAAAAEGSSTASTAAAGGGGGGDAVNASVLNASQQIEGRHPTAPRTLAAPAAVTAAAAAAVAEKENRSPQQSRFSPQQPPASPFAAVNRSGVGPEGVSPSSAARIAAAARGLTPPKSQPLHAQSAAAAAAAAVRQRHTTAIDTGATAQLLKEIEAQIARVDAVLAPTTAAAAPAPVGFMLA